MYRPDSVECLANISTVVIPEDNDDEKKGYESGYPSGCLWFLFAKNPVAFAAA